MTEKRITTTETSDGNTHTETTIIRDEPRSSGGKGWFFLAIIAIAVIAAVFVLSQMGGAQVERDGAITDAADQVGDSAEKLGDAVENVGEELTGE